MRIFDWYYSNGDLPLNKKQRKEIRRSAWRLWKRDWRHRTLYVTSQLVLGLSSAAVIMYPPLNFWQRWILLTTCMCLWSFGHQLLERVSVVPLGRRLMRQRGIEVCIRCGYWLRDLGKDVTQCPECGCRREENKEIESTQE